MAHDLSSNVSTEQLSDTIEPPPHLDSPTTRPARILIVDDDKSVAAAHQEVLSCTGYDAVATSSASESLALLSKGSEFDAIVMDIIMPGIDGLTLMREIRRSNFDVSVVLVTSNSTVETAVKDLQYGGFRYLTKPVAADELVRAVEEAVSMHRIARLKREALLLSDFRNGELGDRAGLELHFRPGT